MQLELRFYRTSGLSAETIWARRVFRSVEYAPRTTALPTRLERVRFILRNREDVRAALVNVGEASPVRVYDSVLQIEYHVQAVEDVPTDRTRMVCIAQAFVPASKR